MGKDKGQLDGEGKIKNKVDVTYKESKSLASDIRTSDHQIAKRSLYPLGSLLPIQCQNA